jgi:hypothetical protein
VEGNERREHGEVVEGAGGEGDEHRGVKAELGEAALGSGGWHQWDLGGRERQSTMVVPCAGMKAKWGRSSSARRGAEIRPGPRRRWPPKACGYRRITTRGVPRGHK